MLETRNALTEIFILFVLLKMLKTSFRQQATTSNKQNRISELLNFDSIRILSQACRFFGCNKILTFQHKSDTPVTRSGSISKSKYLEFEQIRILSQVSCFFVCSNSRFDKQEQAKSVSCDERVAFSCNYFKIQVKSNASGSSDRYAAFSGAIPSKFSNKKVTRRSREFECIRIL